MLPKLKTIIFFYSTAQGSVARDKMGGGGGRRPLQRPCWLIDEVWWPSVEMRSCHLENLAPFVTTHKNYETHRGAHKNDEARVSSFVSSAERLFDKTENTLL